MKVMILCGGVGTRLRELTEIRPKPMVEVGGRPILWHIMKLYAHHGMDDFILCLGYKGSMIKEYFLNYESMNSDFSVELGKKNSIAFHDHNHNEAGWRVTLADTGEKTMTGGRIMRAARYLEGKGTFAATYGDGVTDADLAAALAYHRKMGRLATLTGVRPPSRFGELIADGGLVRAFTEKPQVAEGLINGGFFFFEPAFLRYLTADEDCVLERAPLERCAADGQLSVYRHDGYWQCMDTLRDWESLQSQWDTGRAPWKVWA
ncbi:MAG: glucose-1-phosphate cytidylyltransferase [Actinomycetota bacterium]|nr:glucose-1-phosphate cytidylyltransferase [Actinomycetota bacterium]